MSRLKVPLFDLGNVIVRLDWDAFFSWLAKKAGHGDLSRVRGLLNSSLFFDLEFGSISRETFTQRVGRLYGAELNVSELDENFCNIFPGLVDGMPELVDELLESGPVYCLSNTNEMHLNALRERFPLMQRFTKIFASHEIARRKPYPGIYRDLAQSLALSVKDLVFFDDVPANVEGALRAGMEAHVFEGAEQVRGMMKVFKEMDDRALKRGSHGDEQI
jgi:putative hydrolase of the HAD superfamily